MQVHVQVHLLLLIYSRCKIIIPVDIFATAAVRDMIACPWASVCCWCWNVSTMVVIALWVFAAALWVLVTVLVGDHRMCTASV